MEEYDKSSAVVSAETLETSQTNSDDIYVTAAYFVASLINKGSRQSFLNELSRYKEAKDDSTRNRRKTTSDFLAQLLVQLDTEKFKVGLSDPNTYKFAEQAGKNDANIFALLPAEEGMFYAYNLFAVLGYVYNAQLRKTTDNKMGSSEFITCSINALRPIFTQGEEKLKARVNFAVTKKIAAKNKEGLETLLNVINVNFLPNFRQDNSIQVKMHEANVEVIQALFDYCAEKEDDSVSRKRPEKRVKVYAALKAYFLARTPDDFDKLFTAIAEGIQASRAEGKNKEDSRGAEHALILFRDWLIHTLFINETSKYLLEFSVEQLKNILNSISYRNAQGDVDVSQYAMTLINLIEEKTGENQNALRIQHIKRLVLEVPYEINKSKIDKAQYCFDKGVLWANAITALLQDPSLSEQQRLEVGVCGFVWNNYMEQKGAGGEFTTPQQYVAYEDILKSALLPVEFRKELEVFCKTFLARTQAKRAPIECAKLSEMAAVTVTESDANVVEYENGDDPRYSLSAEQITQGLLRSKTASTDDAAALNEATTSTMFGSTGRTSTGNIATVVAEDVLKEDSSGDDTYTSSRSPSPRNTNNGEK